MCWKKFKRVRDLKVGNIVKDKTFGVSYIITSIYGDRATAARTADLTNPSEWEVMED